MARRRLFARSRCNCSILSVVTGVEACLSPVAARLEPLSSAGLPGWCDRYLDPPGVGEFCVSRPFLDTVLLHALPRGSVPLLALAGSALLLLLKTGAHLGALGTPYTLDWRPLLAP